jgi:hypothetical protein
VPHWGTPPRQGGEFWGFDVDFRIHKDIRCLDRRSEGTPRLTAYCFKGRGALRGGGAPLSPKKDFDFKDFNLLTLILTFIFFNINHFYTKEQHYEF